MGNYIQWTGKRFPFEAREVTRDQFAALGVDNDTVRFDASNGWRVSEDKISDEAWPYLAQDGADFTVVDRYGAPVDGANEHHDAPPLTPQMAAGVPQDDAAAVSGGGGGSTTGTTGNTGSNASTGGTGSSSGTGGSGMTGSSS